MKYYFQINIFLEEENLNITIQKVKNKVAQEMETAQKLKSKIDSKVRMKINQKIESRLVQKIKPGIVVRVSQFNRVLKPARQ